MSGLLGVSEKDEDECGDGGRMTGEEMAERGGGGVYASCAVDSRDHGGRCARDRVDRERRSRAKEDADLDRVLTKEEDDDDDDKM